MAKRNWNDHADQRAAAEKFLKKTIADKTFRKKVMADRNYAREMFKKVGDIDVPANTEVICLGPSTQERAKLVVFALPETTVPADKPLDALKYWLAAWEPY